MPIETRLARFKFHVLLCFLRGGHMQTGTVKWIGEQKFVATSPSGHAMTIDSDRASNKAPGPMELLLLALVACTATDVVIILEKKRQKLEALERICSCERAAKLATVSRVSAQAPAAPPPNEAKIPLSKIPRVHRAPKLEDFLENHPREAELTVTDFRQNTPGDGTPATESTTAYLSYDDKNLYAAFVCHDEAGEIRAHLSKREASDQDDGVGVLLDNYRDFHRAYFFYSNPLGVQTDAIYTEGQGYDFSFDTLWDNAGRVTSDGYIVFFSIPFKSLRFSSDAEQTWGVALYRVILRKGEYDYWPYVTQRVEAMTQQFAPVSGLDNVSPGRNIQFIPYGLLANDRFLNHPNPPTAATPPPFLDRFEHRPGLDAKFVAKDSLTFDVTLNPDFSQVESDDPQLTFNQRC